MQIGLFQHKRSIILCSLSEKKIGNCNSLKWSSLKIVPIPGYSESHAKVTVKEIEPEKEPVQLPAFELPLTNVQVAEGGELVLRCKVVSHPKPEIVWMQNNSTIHLKRQV